MERGVVQKGKVEKSGSVRVGFSKRYEYMGTAVKGSRLALSVTPYRWFICCCPYARAGFDTVRDCVYSGPACTSSRTWR